MSAHKFHPTTPFTHNHLRVLGDLDALPLNDLDIVQAAQNLMLDLERGRHGKLGALLDLEGLVLEVLLASGSGQVNGDGVAAGCVHRQGEDDADAGIVGVGDVLAAAEAERCLVSLEGLVAFVCGCVSGSLRWRVLKTGCSSLDQALGGRSSR